MQCGSATAISDDEAAARYVVLRAEKSAESKFDERVYAFYCRLTAVYPEVEMVPEDELNSCPWACGLDVSADNVIMAIQPQQSGKVMPEVLALAEQLDLVCFDPLAGKVYLPRHLRDGPVAVAASPARVFGFEQSAIEPRDELEKDGGEAPQPNARSRVLSKQ